MKNKFTSGPWKAVENRVFQIKHHTFRIAICTSNIADYPEERANATLISAAPEMYEAIKATIAKMTAGSFPQLEQAIKGIK